MLNAAAHHERVVWPLRALRDMAYDHRLYLDRLEEDFGLTVKVRACRHLLGARHSAEH